jgi:hypothetical protein
MTRRLILFSFMLATFLRANVDPLAAPDAPSSSNKFFGEAELFTGLALSETNQPSALPFDLSEIISEDEQSDGPAFLLSVIGLPLPAQAEMSLVQSSTVYTPSQDPLNVWLLLGVGSVAIALIGGARALRFRRTSAHRA